MNVFTKLSNYLISIFIKCYFSGKKKKDEPHWVEVVTDLMLSLLSQNRHVLRQVVNSVTGLLCPHMTQKALMAIMEVINPLEDANEDEDMDDDDDDDDEFEPIPEEERLKLQQKIQAEQEEAAAEEEEASESESDSEDSEDENVDETNNGDAEPTAELRNQLKAAMGKGIHFHKY